LADDGSFLVADGQPMSGHLKKLVNNIWSFAGTNHELVEVRVDGSNNLLVDSSKLVECAERLFKATKNSLDKFRPLLPKKVIDTYEHGKDGSVQWLDDKMDIYFRGKYSNGVAGVNDATQNDLNSASECLAGTFKVIVEKSKHSKDCGQVLLNYVQEKNSTESTVDNAPPNLDYLLTSSVTKESRSKLSGDQESYG